MDQPKGVHETQPEPVRIHRDPVRLDEWESIRKIEGGGIIKKIDLQAMPKPVRLFGYFVMTAVTLMVGIALLTSLFR